MTITLISRGSPSAYNCLGVGTSQLYNEAVVYNRKRPGRYELDRRVYDFPLRQSLPARLTMEVLLVDPLHNLGRLPEDETAVLPRVLKRARDGPRRPAAGTGAGEAEDGARAGLTLLHDAPGTQAQERAALNLAQGRRARAGVLPDRHRKGGTQV